MAKRIAKLTHMGLEGMVFEFDVLQRRVDRQRLKRPRLVTRDLLKELLRQKAILVTHCAFYIRYV